MSLLKACGPVAIPLALLSLAVFTIAFERVSFWWRWWRPPARQRDSLRRELAGTVNLLAARLLLERRQRSMAFGEPVLQAAVLLAPLLGLVGTVLGLMGVLRELGPQLLLPPPIRWWAMRMSWPARSWAWSWPWRPWRCSCSTRACGAGSATCSTWSCDSARSSRERNARPGDARHCHHSGGAHRHGQSAGAPGGPSGAAGSGKPASGPRRDPVDRAQCPRSLVRQWQSPE